MFLLLVSWNPEAIVSAILKFALLGLQQLSLSNLHNLPCSIVLACVSVFLCGWQLLYWHIDDNDYAKLNAKICFKVASISWHNAARITCKVTDLITHVQWNPQQWMCRERKIRSDMCLFDTGIGQSWSHMQLRHLERRRHHVHAFGWLPTLHRCHR